MLEIRHAKEVRGSADAPPSPDLLFLSSVVALTSPAPVRIDQVADSPLNNARRALFGGLRTISHEATAWRITAIPDGEPFAPWHLPDDNIPWRDFCIFTALGLGREVRIGRVSAARVEAWKSSASAIGCPLDTRLDGEGASLRLSVPHNLAAPGGFVSQDALYPLIGMALGLGRSVSAQIDYAWSSPLRHLLPAFGYAVNVRSNAPEAPDDPLEKRMRYLQKKKRTEEVATFTVTADFSARPQQEVSIELPGDEVLVSLLVAAKAIVQRGSLVINNACLESWAVQNLDFVRKMGCRPALQETRQTTFGSTGMLQLQSFELTTRKTSCRPLCHVAGHLPAMLVTAAFAEGQSVFRDLEDLHADTPDGLRLLTAGLDLMGIRHGDMPDGIVIDGGRDLDGFDIPAGYPAPLSAACAIAGLRCMGATAIEDTTITERWPGFGDILKNICEYRP